MDEVRTSNATIWDRYNERLRDIERNLDKEKSQKPSDIDNIKLEFKSLRELYARLKTCCDKSSRLARSDSVERQVERVIAGYFGTGVSKQEFNRIIESIITASDNKQSQKIVNHKASLDETGETVCTGATAMSDEDMRKIVNEILKIYDADKTGRVDYALESAGIKKKEENLPYSSFSYHYSNI